jgi:hypothetical protein
MDRKNVHKNGEYRRCDNAAVTIREVFNLKTDIIPIVSAADARHYHDDQY